LQNGVFLLQNGVFLLIYKVITDLFIKRYS